MSEMSEVPLHHASSRRQKKIKEISIAYRGTSLMRHRRSLGPYRSPVSRGPEWSQGGGGAVCYGRGTPVNRAPFQNPVETPKAFHAC